MISSVLLLLKLHKNYTILIVCLYFIYMCSGMVDSFFVLIFGNLGFSMEDVSQNICIFVQVQSEETHL